jgi:hypothetical protein
MDHTKQLEQLKPLLAFHLKSVDQAEDVANDAQRAYQNALDEHLEQARKQFEELRSDLVTTRDITAEVAETARKQLEPVDTKVRQLLVEHFDSNDRSDLEPMKDMKLYQEKDIQYSKDTLFKAALQYAPYLLQLDEKAVKAFVLNNAEECKSDVGERYFMLPDRYRMFLPIRIELQTKTRIMNTALIKQAPDEEPLVDKIDLLIERIENLKQAEVKPLPVPITSGIPF